MFPFLSPTIIEPMCCICICEWTDTDSLRFPFILPLVGYAFLLRAVCVCLCAREELDGLTLGDSANKKIIYNYIELLDTFTLKPFQIKRRLSEFNENKCPYRVSEVKKCQTACARNRVNELGTEFNVMEDLCVTLNRIYYQKDTEFYCYRNEYYKSDVT